jgi:hypothetical protein
VKIYIRHLLHTQALEAAPRGAAGDEDGTNTPGHNGAVAGFASRPMRDGPRGEWRCSLRLLAPPGSVLPARVPLREAAPCRGWELGVDGGGGVAEWAKAAPALEAPDYRRLRRDPRWAVSFPEKDSGPPDYLWAAGAAHLGEGWAPGNAPPGA